VDLGLRGAVCVVTGAGSGIGRATVEVLAAEGARLLLTDRDPESLPDVARTCGPDGAAAAWTALDLTAVEAPRRLIEQCEAELGPVDVFVNCAGANWYRSIRELTDADLYAQWDLNVMAMARLLRAVAPAMAGRGGGRIVCVSSVSAKQPSAMNVAYAATKAAQVALVRGFAEEYARDGVVINSLLPGPVDTPLWRAANEQLAAARGVTTAEIERDVAAALPRRRVATTAEVACVIAFLASPLAANVIGAAWTADGGSARALF
jgi:NAD(P)-dependent dehydrogenase (short-subunit alcohol dehydrogenase family)